MSEWFQASIRWLSRQEGGRDSPPSGPSYSTVARFSNQDDASWRQQAWSLVVEFVDPPSSAIEGSARVRFLTDGPKSYLARGARFELMEGARRVAVGTVSSSS